MNCWVCGFVAPGGLIASTEHWVADHCIGPLGVGTLVVRPRRHVVHVGDLDPEEAEELGPLLTRASRVVQELTGADQVYVCLWSHADGVPGHIHFVIQPVAQRSDLRGPHLQTAMFEAAEPVDDEAMTEFAERARAAW